MRRSHKTNTLVLVSDHTKSIYEDQWQGDVFHYTGMGLVGDQDIRFAQNRTVNESRTNGVGMFLFEVFEPGQYLFRGQVELTDDPYTDVQPDTEGSLRKVWVFPLRLIHGKSPLPIEVDLLAKKQEARDRRAMALSDVDLVFRAKHARTTVSTRTSTTTVYERDPYVSEYAKRRAKGICQLCNQPAPFVKNRVPFLEIHHIVWLSRGGADTLHNTVALCPNCHRKMHQLDRRSDVEKLLLTASAD